MGLFSGITNAISSVTNTVTNTVKNVGSELNVGREKFERSDIGGVVRTAVQPVSNVIEIQKDLMRGKFESAGNRAIGQGFRNISPITSIINSSSTVKGIFERDNFFNSWSRSTDAFNQLSSGNSLTQSQVNDVVGMYGKEAAIASLIFGAPAAASAASAWVVANPTTAALIGTQLFNGSKSGNYNQAFQTIGNQISPGLGTVGVGLIPPTQPGSSTGPALTNDYYNPGYAPGSSSMFSSYALMGAGLILILVMFKKMRA